MSRRVRIKQCPVCRFYTFEKNRHTCSEPCEHGFKKAKLDRISSRKCAVFDRKKGG